MSDAELIQTVKPDAVKNSIPSNLTAGMKDRHVMFAVYLSATDNQTKSAVLTGSSHKTARSYGARLAKRSDVQRVVEYLRERAIQQSELTHEWVLSNLKEIVRSGMEQAPIKGPGGRETGLTRMTDAPSATRALELIGKYQGMWNGDSQSVDVEVNVGLADLSKGTLDAAEWERMTARYLTHAGHKKGPPEQPDGPEQAN